MLGLNSKEKWQDIIVKNEAYIYDERFPLLSIHLASNRPVQFTEFVKNMDATCTNKNAYEIAVKIDTEDTAMIACVTELVKKYGEQKIKVLIGARKEGPWSVWEFYNTLLHMTHEKAYFVWLPSDEVRFVTPGWDKILEKYIGFFKDNIFRLKLSDNRLRNFYNLHEVLGTPDNFPFITKKWMDLCGVWGDCHSPDLFQQAVSFYLGKENIFRDIPIFDIELAGIEAGLLIPPAQSYSRTQNIRKLWVTALSKQMRSRYMAHATKIQFFIESCQRGAKLISFKERVRYPSRVIASNIGMKKQVLCIDNKIIAYAWRLYSRYILSKIKKTIMLYMNTPLPFAILVVTAYMLLFYSLPIYVRLASLLLFGLSMFKLTVEFSELKQKGFMIKKSES